MTLVTGMVKRFSSDLLSACNLELHCPDESLAMTSPKRIGIAVVEHAGRYLVGLRGPHVSLAGFAEFPGGKCRADESPIDLAIRECHEESGLDVAAVRLIERLEYEYPHGRVDLHFVLCRPIQLPDVRGQHQGFRWATLSELKSMKFPDANDSVIKLLVNSEGLFDG